VVLLSLSALAQLAVPGNVFADLTPSGDIPSSSLQHSSQLGYQTENQVTPCPMDCFRQL
ncbi:hypothetical protein KI387_042356, partial [Taxus chinensis]